MNVFESLISQITTVPLTFFYIFRWYDGFSTFYVGGDGLVQKHIVDKVMPDQDTIIDDTEKAPIAAKIALLIGLLPRNYLSDVSPYFTTSSGTADNTPLPFKVLE